MPCPAFGEQAAPGRRTCLTWGCQILPIDFFCAARPSSPAGRAPGGRVAGRWMARADATSSGQRIHSGWSRGSSSSSGFSRVEGVGGLGVVVACDRHQGRSASWPRRLTSPSASAFSTAAASSSSLPSDRAVSTSSRAGERISPPTSVRGPRAFRWSRGRPPPGRVARGEVALKAEHRMVGAGQDPAREIRVPRSGRQLAGAAEDLVRVASPGTTRR